MWIALILVPQFLVTLHKIQQEPVVYETQAQPLVFVQTIAETVPAEILWFDV